jgi:hypothetical protein
MKKPLACFAALRFFASFALTYLSFSSGFLLRKARKGPQSSRRRGGFQGGTPVQVAHSGFTKITLADYSLLRRLIRLATNPAPNPLSIFTTVTFEAHELSIPSNAASPSNEAP